MKIPMQNISWQIFSINLEQNSHLVLYTALSKCRVSYPFKTICTDYQHV